MSADGSRFATTGHENSVKVWDTATGQEVRGWNFHIPVSSGRNALVRNMAFAPDNKHVITANANTTLYLLELP
jgi:WD40 repeat protein